MTSTYQREAIAPGLLTSIDEDAQLLGGRCPACSVVTFPIQNGCPRCGHGRMDTEPLARQGKVWTWTTQGFRPKHPYAADGTAHDFKPFVLGYVELQDEVRVETQILVDPADAYIGMDVKLVIVPFRHEEAREIVTSAFAPLSTD